MRINITDQIISQFFSGMLVILVLLAVGAFLGLLTRGLSSRAPFIRTTLIVALSPLSLVFFLGRSEGAALLYFSMTASLIGILIEGLNYLISYRSRQVIAQPRAEEHEAEEQEQKENSNVFVWEKAE